MSALSAAAALAVARVATALLCFVSLSLDLTAAPRAFDATWVDVVVLAYGAAAMAGFFAFIVSRRQSRAGALAMTALDCAFLALMVVSGETGAFVLPLAALMARLRGARFGGRAGYGAAALVVAAFVTASLWSQFWSVHLALVIALAAMLVGAVSAPLRDRAKPEPRSAEPLPAAPKPAPVVAAAPPPVATNPRRVLICDNVPTSRLICERILARAGHLAVGAPDGATALALLEGQGRPFEALVIGGDPPDMRGADLARRIRSAGKPWSNLHIIGVAPADAHDEEWRDSGTDGMFARPMDFALLLDAIASVNVTAGPADAHVAETTPSNGEASVPDAPPAPAPPDETPAIDLRALRDLESLGGSDFVRDIVNQFIVDGAGALRKLTRLTVDGDVELFRDQAHALRSSAANVGARAIYETCLGWRDIAPEQLARDGAAHMRALNTQFQEATAVLEDYIAGLGDGTAPPAGQVSNAA